jgi:hypothetical protein
VGTAGFISKLLEKLFARSRLQVRDNGKLVRFTHACAHAPSRLCARGRALLIPLRLQLLW